MIPLLIVILATFSVSSHGQTPAPDNDPTTACFANQYMEGSIKPAVRHARAVKKKLDEFRNGKLSPKEGYDLHRTYFTTLKMLIPAISQAAFIPEYEEESKYRAGIVALLPGLMAKNPDLQSVKVGDLEKEVAQVDAEYKKLTKEHPELMRARPAVGGGYSAAELELSRFEDKKLNAADVTPEALFPCLTPEKRKGAQEQLNFTLDISEYGQVIGAANNLKEMNDRLKEFHDGRRTPKDGYILLVMLSQEYSSLFNALHYGGSHHPYMQQTATVMRYRVQEDPEQKQFRTENLRKKILETTKEIDSLLNKHPELAEINSFGMNMLQYVKP
jgi:hypothetical protein